MITTRSKAKALHMKTNLHSSISSKPKTNIDITPHDLKEKHFQTNPTTHDAFNDLSTMHDTPVFKIGTTFDPDESKISTETTNIKVSDTSDKPLDESKLSNIDGTPYIDFPISTIDRHSVPRHPDEDIVPRCHLLQAYYDHQQLARDQQAKIEEERKLREEYQAAVRKSRYRLEALETSLNEMKMKLEAQQKEEAKKILEDSMNSIPNNTTMKPSPITNEVTNTCTNVVYDDNGKPMKPIFQPKHCPTPLNINDNILNDNDSVEEVYTSDYSTPMPSDKSYIKKQNNEFMILMNKHLNTIGMTQEEYLRSLSQNTKTPTNSNTKKNESHVHFAPSKFDIFRGDGAKIAKESTKALLDPLFDMDQKRFMLFLEQLDNRSDYYGWTNHDSILMHHIDGSYMNLIHHYGKISLNDIIKFEEHHIHQEGLRATHSRLLYQCLMNSLSEKAKSRIFVRKHDTLIFGKYRSGLLLFKIITMETYMDNQATNMVLRERFTNLQSFIKSQQYNIHKFNAYVSNTLATLNARGETTTDLLLHLFKAYKTVPNTSFQTYLEHVKYDFDHGKMLLTPHVLMDHMKVKYRTLIDEKQWQIKTKPDKTIVAMQAEVDKLKKKFDKSTKKNTPLKKEIDGDKGKTKFSKRNAPPFKDQPPSPQDINNTKDWNGKTYRWCCSETGGKCNPARWVTHSAKDCDPDNFRKSFKKRSSDTKPNDRKLKLAKGLSCVAVDDESDDDSTM